MEKPEFSDLESDLEEELEVENWDEWEGPSKDDDEEDSGKLDHFTANLFSLSQNQTSIFSVNLTCKCLSLFCFILVLELLIFYKLHQKRKK